MLTKNKIWLKRVAALALLLLLLFINIIKFFHTHAYSSSSHYTYAMLEVAGQDVYPSNHVLVQQHCLICDFHLLKDADIQPVYIFPSFNICFPVHGTLPEKKNNTALVLSCSNKGPPALV